MNIVTTKAFKKHYKKRIRPYLELDTRYEQRYWLFVENPHNPILKDHALTGRFTGKRAFWITGDIRVVYQIQNNTAYFLDIGTHNQVYR